MPFNLDKFVASPSVEELDSLKKSEIVKVAKHYGIEFQPLMRKDEIKRYVLEYLVDESILPSTVLETAITVLTDNTFELKKALMSSPVLIAPDFEKQFKLAVDASDTGIGAVLLQADEHGVDHPVCYYSKKFDKHQKNYSTIEKETLALILSLQHFDVYLGTTSFPITVYTDHNPLTFLSKMKNKNQRLMRWSLFLQSYNVDIKHIKGKDNVVPDSLSRI
ncbi:hypothetical protein HOLleu_09493 [Holothuria leucospilota]|uniref:Reverse transcriptase RNase H-like domain-containing protein n=1 Tax=Holothuria leucospilota TaxID=206669 RepID=A0A9Q1HE65_HOLLE|nr:hypothetical protein HOLleu_09493 [Holothuria leucospilota]